ncbi:unnamed protein product [Calicophoron daubneyi]|uniref:Ubiquitin carboxyl-terminal hydrolase n=1 Tax=Calicophoron daubneyi TaxID=300641 RepID=A0AAV2T491_CALDB
MRWLPLESNPDVLNKYLEKLGVPDKWKFSDVIGLDENSLNTVPKPVLAVMLLFPRSQIAEEQKIGKETPKDEVYLVHQTAENACGTVAVLNALVNVHQVLKPKAGSYLEKFIEKTKKMSPKERGHAMENDEELFKMHDDLAKEGQSQAPNRESDTQQHFVSFIEHGGHLYELDGRREHPVLHGNATADSLLQEAGKAISHFVKRDSSNIKFSVLALCAHS